MTTKTATSKSTAKTTTKSTSKTVAKTPATSKAITKTASAKTPVTKSAVAKAPAALKSAAAESAPKPTPTVIAPAGPIPAEELRKKELIEAAVERSGVKKRDAKPAIEAALAIIGEALAEGRELHLNNMGKFKINRSKKVKDGRVIIGRFRQSDSMGGSNEPDETGSDPTVSQAAE